MVTVLPICSNYSVHGAVCGQVVSKPTLPNHLDGAQLAFQYFENVRNFLLAVEDMGLPSFEVSDLEQVRNFWIKASSLLDSNFVHP